jgi:hypothetical protein
MTRFQSMARRGRLARCVFVQDSNECAAMAGGTLRAPPCGVWFVSWRPDPGACRGGGPRPSPGENVLPANTISTGPGRRGPSRRRSHGVCDRPPRTLHLRPSTHGVPSCAATPPRSATSSASAPSRCSSAARARRPPSRRHPARAAATIRRTATTGTTSGTPRAPRITEIEVDGLGGGKLRLRTEVAPRGASVTSVRIRYRGTTYKATRTAGTHLARTVAARCGDGKDSVITLRVTACAGSRCSVRTGRDDA